MSTTSSLGSRLLVANSPLYIASRGFGSVGELRLTFGHPDQIPWLSLVIGKFQESPTNCFWTTTILRPVKLNVCLTRRMRRAGVSHRLFISLGDWVGVQSRTVASNEDCHPDLCTYLFQTLHNPLPNHPLIRRRRHELLAHNLLIKFDVALRD